MSDKIGDQSGLFLKSNEKGSKTKWIVTSCFIVICIVLVALFARPCPKGLFLIIYEGRGRNSSWKNQLKALHDEGKDLSMNNISILTSEKMVRSEVKSHVCKTTGRKFSKKSGVLSEPPVTAWILYRWLIFISPRGPSIIKCKFLKILVLFSWKNTENFSIFVLLIRRTQAKCSVRSDLTILWTLKLI